MINVFTKYAWVKPLKEKKGKAALNPFIEIVNESNCKPNELCVAQGREFYNSKGIDLDKSSNSKECMICRYWFFNHGFNFQDYVCYGCHDLSMLIFNISNIAIIAIKNVDYRCIIHNINKPETINL